jgi:WD40 repeat protein
MAFFDNQVGCSITYREKLCGTVHVRGCSSSCFAKINGTQEDYSAHSNEVTHILFISMYGKVVNGVCSNNSLVVIWLLDSMSWHEHTGIQPTFSPASSPHDLVPIATLQLTIFFRTSIRYQGQCVRRVWHWYSVLSLMHTLTPMQTPMTPNDSSLTTLFMVIWAQQYSTLVSIKSATSDSRGLQQLTMAMMPFSGCGVCREVKLLLADFLLMTVGQRMYKCTSFSEQWMHWV